MEYSIKTEDSKQEVVYQLLCMGCLCGGRTTKTLTDPALLKYYEDILRGVQVSLSGVPAPRLCWECEALLKRAFHFTRQVQECFVILQPSLLNMGTKESPSSLLAQQLTRSPRLTPCPLAPVDLAPDNGLAPGDSRDEFEPLLARVMVEIEEDEDRKVDLACGDAVGEIEAGEPTSEIEDETINRQTHMIRDPVVTTSEGKEKNWIDINGVETKRFQCGVCSKRFLYNSDLKYHMMSHTGEKPFLCMMCDKRFSQNGKLKIHMRTHTGEKLMCPVCQKGYNQTSDLKVHMRTHTGEKPYPCTTCDKAFKKSGDLKIHMRIHTGEKPYKCSVCQKGFNQSGELTIHMRTHTGEKPYKCTLCEKVYNQSGKLKNHMRTHTGERPYKCKECGKGFNQNGELKIHMRRHTGEKPYKCPVCQKGCTHGSELKVHMRTHTGEKPFRCPVCPAGFNQSGNLKSHMKTHAADRERTSSLFVLPEIEKP